MSLIAAIPRFSTSDIRQIGEKIHGDSDTNLQGMVLDPKTPKLLRDMAAGELVKRGRADSVPTAVLQDLNKNPRLPDEIRGRVEQDLYRRGASLSATEDSDIE